MIVYTYVLIRLSGNILCIVGRCCVNHFIECESKQNLCALYIVRLGRDYVHTWTRVIEICVKVTNIYIRRKRLVSFMELCDCSQ